MMIDDYLNVNYFSFISNV